MTTPPPLTRLHSPGWTPEDGDGKSWTPHETLTLYCADCGTSYVATLKCGKRSCPSCRKREYVKLNQGYLDPLRSRRRPDRLLRFMTLTVPNIESDDIPYLRSKVKFIRKAFNRLRRWKAYKNVIQAGLFGIELVNKTGESWNLHVHILYEGGYIMVCCEGMKKVNSYEDIKYFEQNRCKGCKHVRCLRRDWKKVTGGATVVDIKAMYSIKNGLEYISKYMTKPVDISGKTDIYDAVLKGFRLLQPFGRWFGISLKRHAFPCPHCGCVHWYTDFQIEFFRQRARPPDRAPPYIPLPRGVTFSCSPLEPVRDDTLISRVVRFLFPL